MVRRQNSTTAEEIARFQCLFPNPSWLMSGRTSGHQNLVSIFPGINNCLRLNAKESNPGPSIKIGSLNAHSIVNKGPLVMDLIREHRLDALAICESWVVEDDPECIKAGSVPQGYTISHVQRSSAILRSRGGGLCFISRTNIEVKRHPLQNSFNAKSFECQLLKIKLGHGGSSDGITLANIYRPPSHSLKDFYYELSELLSKLGDVIDDDRLVGCGDFNCDGDDSTSIGLDLHNLLDIHTMHQFVTTATHHQNAGDGRGLDLVIARVGSNRISQLSVHPTHDVSDHHLVTWSLATRMLPPRKLITFFHQNLKCIEKKKFQTTSWLRQSTPIQPILSMVSPSNSS